MNLRAILRTADLAPELLAVAEDRLLKDPNLLRLLDLEKNGTPDKKHYAVKLDAPRLKTVIGRVFRAVFQTLSLPPALRKKAEIAARMALKTFRAPKLKGTNMTGWEDETETKFKEEMGFVHEHLDLLAACKKVGVPHSSEGELATRVTVGPFILVNTGGFSSNQMGEASEVVMKAVSLVKAHGLGKVLYGEVNLTNKAIEGGNPAFYLIGSDEIFLRADKSDFAFVLFSFIHELGHRYAYKVLKNVGVKELYDAFKAKDGLAELPVPEEGSPVHAKGVDMNVSRVVGNKVFLTIQGEEATLSVSLENYWKWADPSKLKNPNSDFVTSYAKTNMAENYAELFAFYVLGKLNPRQKELFEKVTF